MKRLTGSHWITHVAIVLTLFFVCGWFFAAPKSAPMPVNRLIKVILGGVVGAGIIIIGFSLKFGF